MPNTVQHGMAQLDVLEAVHASTQRHLFIGTTGKVAVAHGVHPLLGRDAQILDGRRLLNAASRRSIQDLHDRRVDRGAGRADHI